jgi:hypothetical protein
MYAHAAVYAMHNLLDLDVYISPSYETRCVAPTHFLAGRPGQAEAEARTHMGGTTWTEQQQP